MRGVGSAGDVGTDVGAVGDIASVGDVRSVGDVGSVRGYWISGGNSR